MLHAGGRLVFRSPSDAEDEAAPPDALFVPLHASLACTAQLARVMLTRTGQAGVAQGGKTVVLERVARGVASGQWAVGLPAMCVSCSSR